MLNNKGFAVSTVLYTLLIAFLMFLGAALAQLSASSSLIGKANDDIINGVDFKAELVNSDKGCDRVIRVRSRHGIMYWPIDFENDKFENGSIDANSENKKIKSSKSDGFIVFKDTITDVETTPLKPTSDLCNNEE